MPTSLLVDEHFHRNLDKYMYIAIEAAKIVISFRSVYMTCVERRPMGTAAKRK